MPRPIRPPRPNIAGSHPALPSTPGAPEHGQGLAWDNTATAFVWAAMGGGSAVVTGRSGAWPLAGLSLGSTYEADGGYVQLARMTDFPISRSIALADSEYGYTWRNRGCLASADETATNPGQETRVHGATNVRWWSGTYTAALRATPVSLGLGRPFVALARLSSDANANYEQTHLMAVNAASDAAFVRVGIGWSAAPKVWFQRGMATTVASTGITAGQQAAGVWVALIYAGGSRWEAWYCLTVSTTPPTTGWILLGIYDWSTMPHDYLVGVVSQTENTSGSHTLRVLYRDIRLGTGWGQDGSGPTWGATQYDATSATQWAGYVDLGSDAPAIDLASLRLDLASRENLRAGDTATVEWSLVRSAATASPGAGSWYAAAALAESGAGRYLHLYCRLTSSGDTQGSVWWGSPILVRAA